jgi:hypothetical protein
VRACVRASLLSPFFSLFVAPSIPQSDPPGTSRFPRRGAGRRVDPRPPLHPKLRKNSSLPRRPTRDRSYLSFKRVDSIIVQFIKTARNRALLGKFVWAYFGRMCGCPCRGGGRHDGGGGDDDDKCALGGRDPRAAASPPCVEHADNLIRAITRPDFDSRLAGGSRAGRRRRRRCDCSLPPLYLQWEGHSVTVVGVRKVHDDDAAAAYGNPPSFALVVFCPQKNVAGIKGDLAREFAASMGASDEGFDFANDFGPPPSSSSGGGRAIRSVVELPMSRLLQKDCQILLSTARVIGEGESNMRKFCSSNLGFLNAVSIDDGI